MKSPFAFEAMLVFCFLSGMLLVGIGLRAFVPFIQRYLFPSCLVGGIVAMVLMNTGLVKLSASHIESFAFHFFNISFISVGLTKSEPRPGDGAGQPLRGSLWMALIQGVTFPLQAVIGGLVVLVLGWFGTQLFPTFGFLAPLGFNEGPGQALSFGKVWEGAGFQHAGTIGLTFATFGFLFSFFVGVPLINRGIRARGTGGALGKDVLRGIPTRGATLESAGRLTTHSANVESLALHVAVVGVIYAATYFLVYGAGFLVPPDLGKMLWGFTFLFGLVLAILTRTALDRLGLDQLIDPVLQGRITGLSVDYLIVATGAGVQLLIVWQYALPILLISILGGVATTLVVVYFSRRLPAYTLERMAAIYGTVTGTVSCGLLLLRIADPEFKTPAAREIGFMSVFAVPVIGSLTLLVNAPLWWKWSLPFSILIFALIMVATPVLIYATGLFRLRGHGQG